MLEDARSIGSSEAISADIVIIGAGPAGLTLASELGRKNLDVMLVEAGGLKFSKASQEPYRAFSVSPEEHGPTHLFRRRQFGGTSAIWGGRCIPLDPIDFEVRPGFPHTGWPLRYHEVAKFYPKALEILDAGANEFTAMEAIPNDPAAILDSLGVCGLSYSSLERFSLPTHLGKKFKDEMRRSRRVRVLLHCNCIAIEATHDGAVVTGVRVKVDGANARTISSKVVIVAAGGLESPRLLLASSSGSRPLGLGNEHDLVGRFYMAHLEGAVGSLKVLRSVDLGYQMSRDGVYVRRFLKLSEEAQREQRLLNFLIRPYHPSIVDPQHQNSILSAMFLAKGFVVSEYARRMTSVERAAATRPNFRSIGFWKDHLLNVMRGTPQLISFSLDWSRRRAFARRKLPSVFLQEPNNSYVVDLNAEQSPDRESRVFLGTKRDMYGTPMLVVEWKTSPADRDNIRRTVQFVSNKLKESNLMRFEVGQGDLDASIASCTRVGGHHIGTVRMGNSPHDSVLDHFGEVWTTRNLFVSGAATFPTAGIAGPTLTVVALALRLANYIAHRLSVRN